VGTPLSGRLLSTGGYGGAMDVRKVAAGGLMLFLSSLVLIQLRTLPSQLPLYATAAASLSLSLGSLATRIRR